MRSSMQHILKIYLGIEYEEDAIVDLVAYVDTSTSSNGNGHEEVEPKLIGHI